MSKKWKNRQGIVYSTDPGYNYEESQESQQDTLPPGEQRLSLSIERKGRGGKEVTVVKGFIGKEEDLKELGRMLKVKCGTGGSVKDQEILIQGDHRSQVKAILTEDGYRVKGG